MSVYMAENMRLGEYARELAELKLRRQEIAAVKASLADKKKALEDDLHRYELNVKAYELLGRPGIHLQWDIRCRSWRHLTGIMSALQESMQEMYRRPRI